MKKHILLAFCLLSFAGLHAQAVFTHSFTSTSGHIHVTVADSISHDSSYCQMRSFARYVITIDSSFTGDTVRIIDTFSGMPVGGTPVVNFSGSSPWTVTRTVQSHFFSDLDITVGGGYKHFAGTTKITTRIDTLRYVIYNDSMWINPCLYGDLTGKVYIDNNSNCTFDLGDEGLTEMILPNVVEYLSSPMGTIGWQNANFSGANYTMPLQKSWLINYTVSMPPAYAFIFPMSPCFTGPYTYTSLPQTGADFPLQCSSNIDMQCGINSAGRVRLHSPFYLHPYVSNTGCDSVSGTMTLVKDSRVIYYASLSTHPADTVRGDTLIWNYTDLTSVSAGGYWNSFMSDIYLTHDTTVTAGDTLCFRAYTNIPSSDVNPYNNDYAICIPIVYSFDPNNKEVSPAGTGPDGLFPPNTNTLTYTINFQNTGTDYAYDVKIIDTLGSHLDPQSLRILGTSHNMTPKWLTSNVVEFDYKNIMLPDSNTNEPKSHGQVRFNINLKPGTPVGSHIKNTGYIYFDLNPAVITNTTYNTTSEPSFVPQATATKNIKIYPNPATNQLTVENANSGEIFVLNMNGSILIAEHVTSNKTTLNIGHLPSGVYMLKTLNNANTSTSKFTKY